MPKTRQIVAAADIQPGMVFKAHGRIYTAVTEPQVLNLMQAGTPFSYNLVIDRSHKGDFKRGILTVFVTETYEVRG
jgi:hypothetical protein